MTKKKADQLIVIGQCGRAYGVRGWIHVQSHTEPPENLLQYTAWQLSLSTGMKTFNVESIRPHGKHFVAKLNGFESPESTLPLRTANISVTRDELPDIDGSEAYWVDLIGLTALLPSGEVLGKVANILETGANDVLIVEKPKGGELLIPYLDSVISGINHEQKTLIADWDITERLGDQQ